MAGMMQDKHKHESGLKRQDEFKRALAAQIEEAQHKRVVEQQEKQLEAQRLAADAQVCTYI